MELKLAIWGRSLGTRSLGKQIRAEILGLLREPVADILILDFQDVDLITHSFADECFGRLIQEVGLDNLKRATTFRNVNSLCATVLKAAMTRRRDLMLV